MTIYETGCIFYGVAKHFESNFNFCDYEYILPESMKKQAIRYCERHKYHLDKFSHFSKQSIVVFAIVNQLRYRSGYDLADMSEKDTLWFYGLLSTYKNDFLLDIEFLVDNVTKLRDIYQFHIEQKTRWFTMPMLFKFLQYNTDQLINDIPLIKELRWNYRALYILKLDSDFFKSEVEPLQKKLDLILN